jgi:hypothetical protein
MATAESVPPEAVWSLIERESWGPMLVPDEIPDSLGCVVTETWRAGEERPVWELPRRLTYRQRVRRSLINSVIEDLRGAALETPAAVEEHLRRQAEA